MFQIIARSGAASRTVSSCAAVSTMAALAPLSEMIHLTCSAELVS